MRLSYTQTVFATGDQIPGQASEELVQAWEVLSGSEKLHASKRADEKWYPDPNGVEVWLE